MAQSAELLKPPHDFCFTLLCVRKLRHPSCSTIAGILNPPRLCMAALATPNMFGRTRSTLGRRRSSRFDQQNSRSDGNFCNSCGGREAWTATMVLLVCAIIVWPYIVFGPNMVFSVSSGAVPLESTSRLPARDYHPRGAHPCRALCVNVASSGSCIMLLDGPNSLKFHFSRSSGIVADTCSQRHSCVCLPYLCSVRCA